MGGGRCVVGWASRRIGTIQAIVLSSSLSTPTKQLLMDELDWVLRSRRAGFPEQRRLLHVLHSARTLDSCLSRMIMELGARPPNSLGPLLSHFIHHAGFAGHTWTQGVRDRYYDNLVEDRNRYLHTAGEFPANTTEILTYVSELQDCIDTVLSL